MKASRRSAIFNGTTGRAQLRYAPSAKVLLRFCGLSRTAKQSRIYPQATRWFAVANLVRRGPTDKMVFSSVVYLRGADV